MLNNYAVLMRHTSGDECFTQCEANSETAACIITTQRWGQGWRGVEAKISPTFYQEQNAETAEEFLQLMEQRRQSLIKGNTKIVVTPKGEYAGIKAAALAYNQDPYQFRKRVGVEPGFYFKET